MRRADISPAFRRDLDQQRKDFVRWVGSEYERLIEAGIDPSTWIGAVVQALHDTHAEEYDEAA
jgi:hypothetical protein